MDSAFFAELVKEINNVRKNPTSYVDKILGYKKYFKGNVFRLPDSKVGTKTEEGFEAFEQAAEFLKNMKPIDEMVPSKGLGRIAGDYLEKIRHVGPDQIGEIEIDESINKFGNYSGSFNTIMDFGSETPELVLVSFLVSDGDPDRGNREFILDPELKRVGIAREKHNTYGMLTIVISCTEFQNTFDKDDTENYEGLYGAEKIQSTPTPEPTTNPSSTNTANPANAAGNVANPAKSITNEGKNPPTTNEVKNEKNANPANVQSSIPTPEATTTKKKVETINEPIGPSYEEVVNQAMDPDVVSCDRRERFVIQFGRKKRKVIFMKKYNSKK